MRIITLLLALLFAAAPVTSLAAESASIRAILIVASNQKGGSDPKLAPYEPTLRRILPKGFESFRFMGEGSASLAIPGRAAIPLAQGHRLELEGEKSEARRVRLNVRWLSGRNVLMEQPVAVARGTPSVLGGPAWGDKGDVCAVIVIAN
jgi:hypothetical protein